VPGHNLTLGEGMPGGAPSHQAAKGLVGKREVVMVGIEAHSNVGAVPG